MTNHRHKRPSPSQFISNWTDYPAPFRVKVRDGGPKPLATDRVAHNCCGNHGQPGC